MKSKAHIKSHPIHPILVAFPIAFFAGTFIFDALKWFTANEALGTTARYLNIAGIVGAALAAVPGIIDYFFTIPANSSARKRGTKHGLLNVTVLLIFIIALVLRRKPVPPFGAILALDTVGMVLLGLAGWLGGTLVYRNQIGVDIRYANAGKWKESFPQSANGRVAVARKDELMPFQMKLLHVQGKRVVLGRTDRGYVAFDDHCPHRGGSLAGGALVCNTVQCPWHGSQFDVYTGQVKAGPAREGISCYNVEEEGDMLFLRLPASGVKYEALSK